MGYSDYIHFHMRRVRDSNPRRGYPLTPLARVRFQLLTERNTIEVDPWTQQTKVTNLWAAGDCTNVRYHQNGIAMGDATKAIEDIYASLKTK